MLYLLLIVLSLLSWSAHSTGETIEESLDMSLASIDVSLGAGSEPEPGSVEEEYYKVLRTGWQMGPVISHRSMGIDLKNNLSQYTLQFEPNPGVNLGGRFAYKGYGLTLLTGMPSQNVDRKVDTDSYDLQLTFLIGKHGLDFIFQRYVGYYVIDPNGTTMSGSDYKDYPDMASVKFSINYFYAFNEKYSMKAAFDQYDRQLQDAGSILLMGTLSVAAFSNPNSIIESSIESNFPAEYAGLNSMWFTGIGASVGFAYTFVKEYWFFSPAIFLGFMSETQSYTATAGTVEQQVPVNGKLNVKIAAGYNRDDFYYGSSMFSDTISASTSKTLEISASSLNLSFFCGWRF